MLLEYNSGHFNKPECVMTYTKRSSILSMKAIPCAAETYVTRMSYTELINYHFVQPALFPLAEGKMSTSYM